MQHQIRAHFTDISTKEIEEALSAADSQGEWPVLPKPGSSISGITIQQLIDIVKRDFKKYEIFAIQTVVREQKKIVFARTRQPEAHDNRLYVHEVFTMDEIVNKKANENPSTAYPTQTGSPGGSFALCRNILSQLLNVKSETCHDTRFSFHFAFFTSDPLDKRDS